MFEETSAKVLPTTVEDLDESSDLEGMEVSARLLPTQEIEELDEFDDLEARVLPTQEFEELDEFDDLEVHGVSGRFPQTIVEVAETLLRISTEGSVVEFTM